jgi:hypothetical protein
MPENLTIQTVGEHRYLVRTQQDEDAVEILVRASPTMVARLTQGGADEIRVIEATIAYLTDRQRADDLPPQIDLDEMAAAYEGFEGDLQRQLNGPA